MKEIKTTLTANTIFFLCCLFFFIPVGITLNQISKADSFLYLAKVHTQILDYFFSVYTFLGNGIFVISLCVILFLLKQRQLALCLLVGYIFTGLIAQLGKNLIYAPRPKVFFQSSGFANYMKYFTHSNSGASSFPSGHTASAFSVATILAFTSMKRFWGAILFTGAFLVGYSRIYLGHHFPIDVLVGALIGVIFGAFSYQIVYNKSNWLGILKWGKILFLRRRGRYLDTGVS